MAHDLNFQRAGLPAARVLPATVVNYLGVQGSEKVDKFLIFVCDKE
jgi:hypothetical protein